MISFFLRYWKIAAGIGAVAILASVFIYQDYRIESLKKQRDAALVSIASHEKALEILQADTTAKIEALEIERQQEVARVRNLERLKGKIEGASNEKNGAVAPVLRDTVDSLYERTANQN